VAVSVFGGAQHRAVGREDLIRRADGCARFLGLRVFSGGHFCFRDDLRAVADAIVTGIRTGALVRQAPVAGRRLSPAGFPRNSCGEFIRAAP
jgi:surfactin synthase thioesterase subunit